MVTEEQRSYFKAWRAANKEKTIEYRRRYWEKKALERLTTRSKVQDGTNDIDSSIIHMGEAKNATDED